MNPPLTCEIALQSSRSNSVDDVSVLIKPSLSSTRVFDYRKPRNAQYTFGSVIGGFLEYPSRQQYGRARTW